MECSGTKMRRRQDDTPVDEKGVPSEAKEVGGRRNCGGWHVRMAHGRYVHATILITASPAPPWWRGLRAAQEARRGVPW